MTGHYLPDAAVRVQLAGAAELHAVGYGCANQEVLADAMKAAGGAGVVYNGDVRQVTATVCATWPRAPLCA
jgi:hypothetical protein